MSSQSASALPVQRQDRPRGESATEFPRDSSALVALSRLPFPILAVDDSGAIEFANEAFASMVGYDRQNLLVMTAQSLVDNAASLERGIVAMLRGHANSVVRLRHADGWTMPARLSESVLIRDDEKFAVVALTDLTEIAWHTSCNDELLPG